nr:dockerin type I domain-containing protein [Candidatus Shapirobacteria bacterium]
VGNDQYSETWTNGDYVSGVFCPSDCNLSTGKCNSATNPDCEKDKGGTCVASGAGMTGGVKCTISSSVSGTTVLNYSCGTAAKVCCVPSTSKIDGKCTTYGNTLTRKPDVTCVSGTTTWIDSTGSDGDLNWQCRGLNGGDYADCRALYNPCVAGGGSCKTSCDSGESFYSAGNSYCSPGKCCKKTTPTPSASPTKAPVTDGGGRPPEDDGGNTPEPIATAVPTSTVVPTVTTAPTATVRPTITTAPTTTVVPTIAGGSPKISFKFSLRGIKPSYIGKDGRPYDCFDKLGGLLVDVVNSPTNTYQTGMTTKFEAIGETNINGDQVFKVTALALDASKFASVNTYNYVKIKGPFHVKRRMCLDGQTAKLSETTVCNISLKSDTVYDFSDYTLLAGDIDANGIVNAVDYSIVKSNLNASADISCGRRGDLNMDGVVNWIDGSLISKEALSSRDDE